MIAIGLSKQQLLHADRPHQQINFKANLDRAGNTTCSSLLKKQKKLC